MQTSQNIKRIEIVAPDDVSDDDRLNVDLEDLGLSDENIESAEARLVAKRDSDGDGKTLDDAVTITGDHLQIQEGSTGFSAGDVFIVDLVWGLQSFTADSAAS